MGGIWFKNFSKPRVVSRGWAISKIFLSNTYVISTFGHQQWERYKIRIRAEVTKSSPLTTTHRNPSQFPKLCLLQFSSPAFFPSCLSAEKESGSSPHGIFSWIFFQYHSTKAIKGESVTNIFRAFFKKSF